MSFESLESLTSFLFDDTEPIMTTPEEMKIYNEIYLDFQKCLDPEPITAFGEANTTILSGAMAEEVEPAVATLGEMNTSTDIKAPAGEAIEHPKEEHQLGITSSPSEVITAPPPVTEPSMNDREKITVELQRPDFLTEGWTTDIKVREYGSSAGKKDQVIRTIDPSKSAI